MSPPAKRSPAARPSAGPRASRVARAGEDESAATGSRARARPPPSRASDRAARCRRARATSRTSPAIATTTAICSRRAASSGGRARSQARGRRSPRRTPPGQARAAQPERRDVDEPPGGLGSEARSPSAGRRGARRRTDGMPTENAALTAAASCSCEYAQLTAMAEMSASARPISVLHRVLLPVRAQRGGGQEEAVTGDERSGGRCGSDSKEISCFARRASRRRHSDELVDP